MTGLKSKLKREKLRAQVKSRWYYIFWGACTVSVFAGQIYVGYGFRRMADSLNRWFDETIQIIQPKTPRGFYLPIVPPPTGPDFHENDIVIGT